MTISAEIAESIKRQIAEGILRPGDRLPAERDLAEQLGVARSPLREALRELRAQGYLVSGKGRQRTLVASLADTSIGDPLARLLTAGTGRFVDLIELRLGLEVQAAGLAALRRQPEDMKAFEEIVSAMAKEGRSDKQRSARLDAAFHGTLANATHNVFYMHVTAELVRLLHENIPGILDILYTEPESAHELVAQHRRIASAVGEGRADEARQAMADHLAYVLEGLEHIDGARGARVGASKEGSAAPTPRRGAEPQTHPITFRGVAVSASPLDRDLVD